MRWYADNSELLGVWDAELPDVLLYGGIAVPRNEESTLLSGFDAIKADYAEDTGFPLKWNFKDLRKTFEDAGLTELFDWLRRDSREWREKVFSLLPAPT